MRFKGRLEECLAVLAHLLERPSFGTGERTIGAECDVFLIDDRGRPLPLNEEVLAESSDPRLAVEVDRFNLECNRRPSPLAGRPFAALAGQLEDALSEMRRAAASNGGRIAVIGILPTLKAADLTADAMTDVARYRALDRSLRTRRREPFRVRVRGEEELSADSESVSLEGVNTSLHLHVRAEPADFSALFNTVQAVLAPVLAVAGNSPLFLGRRLWQETRVALFKQATDDRDAGRRPPGSARDRSRVLWSPMARGRATPALRGCGPDARATPLGTLPFNEKQELVGEGDVALQTACVLENIRLSLEEFGATPADVVRTKTYVIDMASYLEHGQPKWVEFFAGNPPTSTAVGVTELADPRALVEIEAYAEIDEIPSCR